MSSNTWIFWLRNYTVILSGILAILLVIIEFSLAKRNISLYSFITKPKNFLTILISYILVFFIVMFLGKYLGETGIEYSRRLMEILTFTIPTTVLAFLLSFYNMRNYKNIKTSKGYDTYSLSSKINILIMSPVFAVIFSKILLVMLTSGMMN